MKMRYFAPLIGFVVPTIIIGFGLMIPRSCIAGFNDLTVGFSSTIVGACVSYWLGVRTVLGDRQRGGCDASSLVYRPPVKSAPRNGWTSRRARHGDRDGFAQ
jgi:hypothetical protein